MPTAKRPLETLFQIPWTSGTKEHAALTATATVKLYTVPAGKTLRIDRVWYNNPTGLALSATDSFKGEIKNGATVVNTMFNTATGGASLGVDTPVFGTNSATDANRVLVAGDTLSVVFTETGTATLPAGSFVVEGRFV